MDKKILAAEGRGVLWSLQALTGIMCTGLFSLHDSRLPWPQRSVILLCCVPLLLNRLALRRMNWARLLLGWLMAALALGIAVLFGVEIWQTREAMFTVLGVGCIVILATLPAVMAVMLLTNENVRVYCKKEDM